MNKFILKMNLVPDEDCTLIIDIVQWDHRFISKNNGILKFCYFQDSHDFTIYSQHNGSIFEDSLEIPEYGYMHNAFGDFLGAQIKKKFYNDDKRFLYLKGLHRCLNEWAIKWDHFENDIEPTDGIILNNDYWIK